MKKVLLLIIIFVGLTLSAKSQLTNNLVSYWTFNGTASDITGNNNGTVMGASISTSGKIGSCYSFDGVNDYIECAYNPTLNITASVSLSAWINTSTINNQIYVAAPPSSNSHVYPYVGYGITATKTNNLPYPCMTVAIGTGVHKYIMSSDPISSGVWYHIVGVYDQTSLKIYVNGVLKGTLAVSGSIKSYSTPLRIGANGALTEGFFGLMDEVGLWNRALTASEVTALYNGGVGLSYPFTTTSYTLSTSASPSAGGTISLSPAGGSYAPGTTVSATATANSDYSFTGWSGALTGTTNPGTVTMDANKTLTATFTPATTYSLTITPPTNGTITASPAGPNYAANSTVTVTATPSANYQLSSWGGSLSGATNPTTLIMNGNKTVSATFSSSQTSTNTPPLPSGETVIGEHLHVGLGNEVWTNATSLYFNYRGTAATTHFWNLGGSSGKPILTLLNNGNVGIGTESPSEKLDVNGNMLLRNSSNVSDAGAYIHFSSYGFDFPGPKIRSSLVYAAGGNTSKSKLVLSSYWEGYKDELTLMNGNVGIGTYNPSSKLTVNGKILATEVEVVSSIASDYVFEPEYRLMPLTELEPYLKLNKHLPGIPSAAEFSEKGQNLAKTDDMLLKKIEELTLYILQLKKETESFKKENEEMKTRLEILEKSK